MTPNRLVLFFGLLTLAAGIRGQEYEFEPPSFPDHATGQVFSYFLPAYSGFAANVNLMVQHFDGDLQAYDELTRNQFEQYGVEVLEARMTHDEMLYHYQGRMSGFYLRFFARAIKRGNRVFLITATALPGRWDSDGKVLEESVLNFKLKPAAEP